MPPDRTDLNANPADARTEVVDVFGKDETVTVGAAGEVDLNSATEGDGRTMATEGGGGGNADDRNDEGRVQTRARDVRGDRGTARTARATDGDEDGDYSSRVRKRIARERTLVNRERTLREQTQRELAQERAARQAQDERIARLERAQTDVAGNASVKELEAKIEALKPQLSAAIEAGDTAKQLELQDRIADLRGDLKVLKYDLAQRQRQTENQTGNRGTQQQGATDTTSVVDDPRVAELATQFQKANRHWWNRSGNKEAREDAITIDREILGDIQAGELAFEPYSDEHFEELARRLHDTYPDLEIQDLDGQPYNFDEDEMTTRNDDGRQQNGGNGTRGANRGQPPIARRGQNGRQAPSELELARQGKVELNQQDFQNMRTFKMDPNNPTDKKYYAKEKMRSILTGARQQGDR